VKTLSQVIAICCGMLLLSMIVHKAFVDVSALAGLHSGERFWLALARYFITNLAG
jgi:hypothetical protein